MVWGSDSRRGHIGGTHADRGASRKAGKGAARGGCRVGGSSWGAEHLEAGGETTVENGAADLHDLQAVA